MSEDVFDKTAESSCHSRLLRRKEDAYLSVSTTSSNCSAAVSPTLQQTT